MKSNKVFTNILLIVLIIILTFTPVIAYVPALRRTWIILLVGIAVLSPFNLKFYVSNAFFCLIFSIIIMLFNVFSADTYYSEVTKVFSEFSMLIIVVMITKYAIQGKNKNFLKWCVMTFFFIVAIETTSTYIIDQQIPGALRALFSESLQTGEREEFLYPYYRMGLSNYKLPHVMPILIPPLVMGFREKTNSVVLRIWSLLFLLFSLELVWLSGVMTAFILAILFLFLSVYVSFYMKPNLKVFFLFGLFFLPFAYSDDLTLYIIKNSQNLFSGNDFVYRKLLLLEENIYSYEAVGDVAERQNLYIMSLNEFFNNIFIGTNNPMGNHSTFIDRLGTLGLVGFVPYILFFYIQIKTIRRYIPKSNRIYNDMGIAAGTLMMLLKDVDDWELYLTLFTITPLLVIYLSPNKIEKK